MSSQAKYQISFLTGNADASQLYVEQSNALTLNITNQSGQTQQLTGGPPANPPAAGGPFSVALDLGALFVSAAEQASLVLTSTSPSADWVAQYFGGEFPVWVLCPPASLSWTDSETLSFAISNLTPTAPTGSCYVSVTLENLGGRTLPAQQCPLALAQPPASATPHPLQSTVAVQLANEAMHSQSSSVYVSRSAGELIPNTLTLSLYNTQLQPLAAPPAGSGSPRFVLSFVAAEAPPGYYALTTPSDIAAFQVAVQTPGWTVTTQTPANGPTQWVLAPPADALNILGTGDEAIASFSIANVISQFAPDQTLVYLQSLDIPGYDDSLFSVLLYKQPAPAQIKLFTASQYNNIDVPFGQPATVTLAWEVQNATNVFLAGVGPVPSTATAWPFPIITNQPAVLTAFDTLTGTVLTSTLQLSVQVPISNRLYPVNGIAIWSGGYPTPTGWDVCDGTNGTPSLGSFFPMGAGTTAAHQFDALPTHSHNLYNLSTQASLSSVNGQSHDWPSTWSWVEMNDTQVTKGWANFIISTDFVKGESSHSESHTFPAEAAHSHSLSVTFSTITSNPNTIAPRPSWYALLYIRLYQYDE
jgi:hypothetical protein